jgi:hypothetical protein
MNHVKSIGGECGLCSKVICTRGVGILEDRISTGKFSFVSLLS